MGLWCWLQERKLCECQGLTPMRSGQGVRCPGTARDGAEHSTRGRRASRSLETTCPTHLSATQGLVPLQVQVQNSQPSRCWMAPWTGAPWALSSPSPVSPDWWLLLLAGFHWSPVPLSRLSVWPCPGCGVPSSGARALLPASQPGAPVTSCSLPFWVSAAEKAPTLVPIPALNLVSVLGPVPGRALPLSLWPLSSGYTSVSLDSPAPPDSLRHGFLTHTALLTQQPSPSAAPFPALAQSTALLPRSF